MAVEDDEPQLRDLFAALCPISLKDAISYGLISANMGLLDQFAELRYKCADAMLEARKK